MFWDVKERERVREDGREMERGAESRERERGERRSRHSHTVARFG